MNLEHIIAQFIDLLNILVKQILPDEITPDKKANLQQIVPVAYAAAVFALPPLVAKTATPIDDAGAKELKEICEDLANKYNLQLNPLANPQNFRR